MFGWLLMYDSKVVTIRSTNTKYSQNLSSENYTHTEKTKARSSPMIDFQSFTSYQSAKSLLHYSYSSFTSKYSPSHQMASSYSSMATLAGPCTMTRPVAYPDSRAMTTVETTATNCLAI